MRDAGVWELAGLIATATLDPRAVERERRGCVTTWRQMAGLQVPLAHQMLQKLLVEKIVCEPLRDEFAYELRAKFAYGAVFSGVIGLPMAVVAVRGSKGDWLEIVREIRAA